MVVDRMLQLKIINGSCFQEWGSTNENGLHLKCFHEICLLTVELLSEMQFFIPHRHIEAC